MKDLDVGQGTMKLKCCSRVHPFNSPREDVWVWKGEEDQRPDVRLFIERGECFSQWWEAICMETNSPLEGIDLLNVSILWIRSKIIPIFLFPVIPP